MRKTKIFQIKREVMNDKTSIARDLMFFGAPEDKTWNDIKECYAEVWEEEWSGHMEEDSFILNTYFERFNLRHPKGYNGRSMSVSDVVQIDDRFYYCQPVGWKDITE